MKTRIDKFSRIVFTTLFVVLLSAANINVAGAEISAAGELERVAEIRLVLEDWMVNDKYWEVKNSAGTVRIEAEPLFEIENWMINESKWGFDLRKNIIVPDEKNLKVEDWMINNNLWN